MLTELLKKHLGEDEAKINAFLEEMKNNKIFITNEENIDLRYGKLKGNYDALVTKDKESQALIEQLKSSNKGNEEMQTKIGEYERRIAELEKQNEALTIDNAIKFELLSKGAKPDDIDYLIFKAKQCGNEFKLDKDGNVKGLDNIVDDLKKTHQSNFEVEGKKTVQINKLNAEPNPQPTLSKEQFNKMGYNERVKLYNDNPELYEQLSKGE